MRYALLLAVAAVIATFACATPAPSQYERGAPGARPLPARPRPRVGPTYAPGSPGIQVEPGPRRTRILPETPETMRQPGLWSAEEPKASASPGVRPSLLEIHLPLANNADEGEKSIAVNCSRNMINALSLGMKADLGTTLQWALKRDDAERRCMAARLYRACVEVMAEQYQLERAQGTILAPENERTINAALGVAQAFEWAACPRGALTNEGSKALNAALHVFTEGVKNARREDGQR